MLLNQSFKSPIFPFRSEIEVFFKLCNRIQKAIDFVRTGDIFMVEAIDQLGRNYDEIILTVNLLKKRSSVDYYESSYHG